MSKPEPSPVAPQDHSIAAGFRLERLELLNWGTFHGDAQTFEPSGGWALLIGDNGSGKSTAIDALRTLLVPPRMLNYNDAAVDGRRIGGRDRTRRSYVRGAWASSSTIDSTTPTTQYLRGPGDLSAIAAVFTDAQRHAAVTVAQVLWEHEEQIRELYAVGTGRRGLRDLMAGHSNTGEIRRAARRSGWTVEDGFAAYAERMRELLHIPGDKALEVFNRAIGMKEVTDIDAFVRQFMLPSADTFGFIRDTVQPHYRTLLDCWGAIEKAERQVTLLRPVAERAARINDGEQRIDVWRQLQEVAVPYFASRHLALLRATERDLLATIEAGEASRAGVEHRLTDLRTERDVVNAAIASSDVGVRLQLIQHELDHAEQARRQAFQRRARIDQAAQLLGTTNSLADAVAFSAARQQWQEREHAESVIASEADERYAEHRHEQELALQVRLDKTEELQSVERHRVNIPRHFLAVRARLAQAIGVAEERMPFAGELVEVSSAYEDWTGAIERLLRSFGLALLVPEDVYRPAAEFINATSLGLRLTFHRVPVRPLPAPSLSPDRVPGRLEYRTDHPLHSWVANELVRRFNHRCCGSIGELEATDRGLTREGLVREGTRHVKDDARPVEDFSAKVLGWSTERKITALKEQIGSAERRAQAAGRAAADASRAAATARDRASAARELLAVTDFFDIDPTGWSKEILRLRTEQERLEHSSDTVRTLKERLRELDEMIRAAGAELSECDKDLGGLRHRLDTCRSRASEREHQLADAGGFDDGGIETVFAEITASLPPLTLENADQLTHMVHQSLGGRISNEQRKVNEASQGMIAGMSDFLNQFTEFKQNLQPRREYADSFEAVLRRIEEEDLPQHRVRFEQYLNENLVGDLLMLNRRLDEHIEAIETRIGETNEALRRIDYGDDTYVQLRLNARPTQDATEFRRNLRDCFEHGIAPAPEERLVIFDRVRALLERFQSDPEGTQKVTDVRTWYVTGVQELRRSDDSEVNYYAATTGKSGGQKAKLAFTILASALSAQYGLSNSPSDSPNFRLVVIDEAFSRTDESNSTRAMQLFERLGFQVVIVGPFDAKAKLAVPFVGTVHLASNPAGNSSRLMALTREQVEAAAPDSLAGSVASTGSSSVPAL
jgi:uncharacterized protein YPO0396